MRVLGEGANDGDALVGGCIGPVDDPGRCLCARDQQQGRPHILGLGQLPRHLVPHAQLHQRRLAVPAGGDRVDVRDGEAAVADQRGEVEARLDIDGLGLVPGRDQHDAIAEQVGARPLPDQALLLHVVHPGDVG